MIHSGYENNNSELIASLKELVVVLRENYKKDTALLEESYRKAIAFLNAKHEKDMFELTHRLNEEIANLD